MWPEFRDSFLPENEKPQLTQEDALENAQVGANQAVMPLSVKLSQGQRGENEEGDKTIPAIGGEGAEFVIQSAIPITSLFLDGKEIILKKDMPKVGVLPMGENQVLQSEFKVTVNHSEAEALMWEYEPIYDNVPNAIWGIQKSGDELVKGVAVGIRIRPLERKTSFFPKNGYIDLNQLSIYSCINRTFNWNPVWQLPSHSQENPIQTFSDTVMEKSVCNKRKAWIESMNEVGFAFDTEIDLTKMAKEADSIFTEEMILGVLV